MQLAHPFWLLLILPLGLYLLYRRRHITHATILFPNLNALRHITHFRTKFIITAAFWSRILAILCIIIALSRPQEVSIQQETTSQGIDIMLSLDVSGSMAAEDFKPNNRLAVAKLTIKEFINKRVSDRIGLVVFGRDAYTQCPLTLDYSVLSGLLDDISLNSAGQGTAIGMAIVSALNRLKDSPTDSKIIILLTDGENNRGEISPRRAAEIAKRLGIKIYTIGIGKEGGAPIPYIHPLYGKQYSTEKTFLDEETLTDIATLTNGRYFRATDKSMLHHVLSQINQLETSDIKSTQYHTYGEWFPHFITASLIFLLLELLLSYVIGIKIP